MQVSRWPAIFSTPLTGNVLQSRIRRMPILHVNHQLRILQNTGVAPFEPVIPPANSLIAPLDLRAGNCVVREGVIPRSYDCFQRRFGLFEHIGDAVSITIEQAADDEAGNFDLAVQTHRAAPERSVMLVLEVEK